MFANIVVPGVFSSVLALILSVSIGGGSAPEPEPAPSQQAQFELIPCGSQAQALVLRRPRFRIQPGVVEVTPEDRVIARGDFMIEIPEGAISEPTRLRIAYGRGGDSAPYHPVVELVTVPAGVRFSSPVIVGFNMANCEGIDRTRPIGIVRLSEPVGAVPGVTIDGTWVRGRLTGFSEYALAYF
jgi:hypothetical protein